MPFVNPYIQEVLENKSILTDTKKLYANKGRWGIYFGNSNDIYLEIGTGMGNFFSTQIEKNPNINFVGLELKRKRLASTYKKSANSKNANFVVCKDFGQHICDIFSEQEISRTYILFPDPWGKKEYQKKNKLLQSSFFENLYSITKKGGNIIIKTDDQVYFDEILSSFKPEMWKILLSSKNYEQDTELFSKKSITEFESIWRGKKKSVCYLELERC